MLKVDCLLDLLDLLRSAHFVRGVGGDSSESVRVEMVDLPWLEMAGGVRFDQVSRGVDDWESEV